MSRRSAIPSRAGLTLVEVAVIVSVLGMLLAVAIPTLARSLRTSKVMEASEQLEVLYRAAEAYYATPRTAADGHIVHCLPEAAGPAPNLPAQTATMVDFGTSQGAATWLALGFAPHVPLRYRYTFLPTVAGCSAASDGPGSLLTLRAEGDLDGDSTYSNFERRAHAGSQGKLAPDPVLHISDRIE